MSNELVSAFDHCMDKIDAYVHTHLPREQVLWIADKSQYEKLIKDNQSWFRIRVGINWENLGFEQKTEPHGAHIIDTIYFADSRDSRALQLADVLCSTVNLHLQQPAYAKPYYELIHRQVVSPSGPS